MSWLDERIDVDRPRVKQLLFDDGALTWLLVSVGLLVLLGLLVLVEMQSQRWVYWSGATVTGRNEGGIVFYYVHGEQYTLDDPGPTPDHPTPRRVYYDPNDPYVAMLDGPLRLVEEGVFYALAGGAVVSFGGGIVVGEVRRRRRGGWRGPSSPS